MFTKLNVRDAFDVRESTLLDVTNVITQILSKQQENCLKFQEKIIKQLKYNVGG